MKLKDYMRDAYNAGSSNQEMQDAGLEGMTSFSDWFLWYNKEDHILISKQQLEQLNTLINKITSHPTAKDVIKIKELMKEIN